VATFKADSLFVCVDYSNTNTLKQTLVCTSKEEAEDIQKSVTWPNPELTLQVVSLQEHLENILHNQDEENNDDD
jgi:hypothetical protein